MPVMAVSQAVPAGSDASFQQTLMRAAAGSRAGESRQRCAGTGWNTQRVAPGELATELQRPAKKRKTASVVQKRKEACAAPPSVEGARRPRAWAFFMQTCKRDGLRTSNYKKS